MTFITNPEPNLGKCRREIMLEIIRALFHKNCVISRRKATIGHVVHYPACQVCCFLILSAAIPNLSHITVNLAPRLRLRLRSVWFKRSSNNLLYSNKVWRRPEVEQQRNANCTEILREAVKEGANKSLI